MKEPTNTQTKTMHINGTKLSLKARVDDSDVNTSGWSIIAFTHSASIRCVRAHQVKHLDRFIHAIAAICYDTSQYEEMLHYEETLAIYDALMEITNNTFAIHDQGKQN
jgi:hypothetical protein